MNDDPLASLQARLDPWTLLQDDLFNVDLDAYIDERDSELFEREWLRVYGEISSLKDSQTDPRIDDIERAIFLRVSQRTGQHEVASYVADDFRMICRALAIGYSDPWLNGLFAAYMSGRLPNSTLQPMAGSLANLV